MTTVAISREMGSGGNEIGTAVAKTLNFEHLDWQILLQAVLAHGVPEVKLVRAVDHRLRRSSLPGRWRHRSQPDVPQNTRLIRRAHALRTRTGSGFRARRCSCPRGTTLAMSEPARTWFG